VSEIHSDGFTIEKLRGTINRIASIAVGLSWSHSASYHQASLLAHHSCSVMLIHLHVANTDETRLMVFEAVSAALKQYYSKYVPLEEPINSPAEHFIRKEVMGT
jgi:hypothetical protein